MICGALGATNAPAQEPALPPAERVYSPSEVTTPAVILSSPKPEYPREAGKYDVPGTIELRMVLAADGKVRDVEIVKGLSQGQNTAALRAARRIKFMVAKRGGESVAQSYTVEYPFEFVVIEDGAPGELRGVRKIFVDTGGDVKEQRNIIGEILARLPKLEVVDAAEEAEVVLEFNSSGRTARGNYVVQGELGYPKQVLDMTVEMKLGQGQAVKRVSATKLHVLLKFYDPQFNLLERKPSTNFARAFIKAYQQANDLSDK
jgi:TonB family protein